MTKQEYYKYLQSPEWAAIRADIIFLAGGKCEKCGRNGNQVHHKTYKNLGNEEPEDLILLCGRCHKIEHGLIKLEKPKKIAKKPKKKKKRRRLSRQKQRLLKEEIVAKARQAEIDRELSEKSRRRLEDRLKRMGLMD